MAEARRRRRANRRRTSLLDRLDGWFGWLEKLHPTAILRGVLLTVLFGAMGLAVYQLLDVPITQVTLEGPFRRVSNGQLEAVLRRHPPAGFLSADLEAVRDAVEAMPWVDVARVRRVWPDGLLVSVTEQVAVARWGDASLLNARGELFLSDSRHVPAELPRLSGPPGSEGEVSERYLDYVTQLEPLGLTVLALSLDARGAWRIRLRGGLPGGVEVRLGRHDPDERMRRFVTAASGLVRARSDQINYVDMRYGNGFAVGWIDGATRGS